MAKRRAVFLDRDGVLNHVVMRDDRPTAPRSISEFNLVNGAATLVQRLKNKNFLTIVVTNQPDVGRGLMPESELKEIHSKLKATIQVDAIEACTSGDNANSRRKPNPGMILEAAETHEIELSESWLVGDGAKDIEAGKRAGVKTILIETEYNLAIHGSADFNCSSLEEVFSVIEGNQYELCRKAS